MQGITTTVDSKEPKNVNQNLYLTETYLKGNLSVSPSCK